MSRAWETWVRMWDLRESPLSLALIRVTLGLVMLWDLLQLLRFDLVVPLLGVEPAGGFSPTLRSGHPSAISALLPHTPSGAWLFYGGLLGTTLGFTVGLFTRVSLVGFVLLSTQWEAQLPGASRAIESAIRIVCLLLAFSQSHAMLSVEAWWRTGSVWGDGGSVPAWPRHLVLCQLALMYFFAGVQKFSLAWSPAHGFSALYLILQDPAVARFDFDWVIRPPWLQLTQLGTAVTMVWEWGTPVLLLAYWYRFTADRPGRVRAWFNRWRIHLWWAGIGVIFHVGIFATLALGIFPAAMLAFYWAFLHPDELVAAWERVSGAPPAWATRPSAPG